LVTKLSLDISKEDFVSRMEFEDEEERERCLQYLNLKGVAYHTVLANYIGLNVNGIIQYKRVQNLYIYDKRVRNILYRYLSALEEGIRGIIANNEELKIMRIQIDDLVDFELTVDSKTTIQKKKIVKTASIMVPTNIGPYHSVYKEDVEVPDSLEFISQRTLVGSKLLGMSKNEVKEFVSENREFKLLVLDIQRDGRYDDKISIELHHQKWLKRNCLKCAKKYSCPYFSSANNKSIMYKKISENTLDSSCKFFCRKVN